MSRPITVRLPESARLTLDAVVQQTQRSITWLLTEAIYDAGQAYALDPHALDKYLSADIGVPRRTTFHLSDAADQVLATLSTSAGRRPAEMVRAAWLHFTTKYSVEEITAFAGAVRPAVGGVA